MKAIYFDLDGTLADLYGVENWLTDLRAYSTRPYAEAKPLVALSILAPLLNRLQKQGYKLGVVSWASKNSNEDFDSRIEETKREWLAKHMPSVSWDEIHVVSYGVPKSSVVADKQGILFDDEEQNRTEWKGTAYDVDSIIKTLRGYIE